MRFGQINGFTGLSPNRPYFVGETGRPSVVPPEPLPGGVAYVQIIGRALGTTVMMVSVSDDAKIRRGWS
jgi:hypothetical protein